MIGSKYHTVKSEVLCIRLALYGNSGSATKPPWLSPLHWSHKVVMTQAFLLTELMNHLLSALRLQSSSQ